MKNLRITVNGRAYDVQVEELSASSAPAAVAPAAISAPAPAPAAVPAAAPAPAVETAAVQGAQTVNSPMPGTIVNVQVNVGDQVKEGGVLLVLEAMKMENEIMAPCAGTVASIHVRKGDSVSSGQLLVSIG